MGIIGNTLLFVLALIILGLRLPSFMRRMGMSKKDKVILIICMFTLLGFAWLAVYGFSVLI